MWLVALTEQMGNWGENQFMLLSGLVEKNCSMVQRIMIQEQKKICRYIYHLFTVLVSIFTRRIRVLVSNFDCCCLSYIIISTPSEV